MPPFTHYQRTVTQYSFRPQFIPPQTLEDSGPCEHFIRSFNEQRVWQQSFESIEQARP